MYVNNNNEKKYYNENISEIVNEWITEERYGDLTPIIKDIIYRRAYEYEINEEDVRVEVESFVQNVKTIEFVHKDDERILEKAMGVYSQPSRAIILNADYFSGLEANVSQEEFGTQLYETLTHEVYHALSDQNGCMGLEYYDYKTNEWKGIALNEVFTETAANRACITRTSEDAEKYRSETQGYTQLTFVTNFLAASLKCTEKEILSAGIKNMAELMNLFYSRFPNNKACKSFEDYFNSIEASLDILYNTSYNQDSQMSEDERQANMEIRASALKKLYKTTFKLASCQIANDEVEVSDNYSSHVVYRFSKMDRIMKDSLATFEQYGEITCEMKEQILADTIAERDKLATQVSQINDIVAQSYKIENNLVVEKLKNAAQKGKLANYTRYLNKSGIQLHNCDSNNIGSYISQLTDSLSVTRYIIKEDFDDGKKWNNSQVSSIMKRVFDDRLEELGKRDTKPLPVIEDVEQDATVEEKGIFTKLRDSVKNIIVRFKNRNQKKLENKNQEYYTNGGYYASLATNKFEQENKLSQYTVDLQQQRLHLEELNVSEIKNEREPEER